jgi:ATP-dependent Lhr-like helicase
MALRVQDLFSMFDPLVEKWFRDRFGSPTPPQEQGWEAIATGCDALISAPTGSGKTLAAFLICLDRLVRAARAGTLADATQVVYVSPLKALSNDIHRNLEVPLAEIAALADREGIGLQPIRAVVRTGDTPVTERTRMLRKPPHIVVTTPESFYILLTAEKSREMLRTVSTIIVDEIHGLVDDKRGSHLALSIARLDALTGTRPQRIGLSATVKPIKEVARFLGPATRVVNTGHRRGMDLAVEVPGDELGAIATNEMWAEIYDRLAALILQNRTTLVFVNTRRLSERVAHALGERLGSGAVLPHHGSLSRQLRLDAESRLKNGELRAVVATASLELGIDIGTVDLVCQIGTPRSVAVALQRIGRSGHLVGARPHGRLFATTRDELIECAAVISAIRQGILEETSIPQNALDILAQQIVAACAADTWSEGDLYTLFRSAYPYRDLLRADFDAVLEMLSEGIATSRGRSGSLLHRDGVNGKVKGRRGARLTAITSGGAIPENANYAVVAEPDGKVVGTLDEDFAMESMAGDVFLLGTHSWRIKRVEAAGRVRVEDAHGAAPTIPFWLGEAPGRSRELSEEVARVRERILADADSLPSFLLSDCGLDEGGAKQAAVYVRTGAAELGALPSRETVVAERFFDQSGGMQLVLHAPFGSRITRAWGLALRKRFCRSFNFELQAAATDNGLLLSLSDQHSFPLELVFAFLKAATVEDVLRQALLTAPLFGARWRWNTTRALAVLRSRSGARVPAPIQRMRADDLLASVFPDQVACQENLTGPIRIPDHPLVKETIENCLHEGMDLPGLREVLEDIEAGNIRTVAIDTALASQFSHEILNANPYAFLDDAPLEERRARAVQLRQSLGKDVTGEGVLDPAIIQQISAEAFPEVRDADELHDALLTVKRLPPSEEWSHFFSELEATRRISIIEREGKLFWVAAERTSLADDADAVVGGWMEYLGPVTVPELVDRIGFDTEQVETALLRLEASGQVLRGHFRNRSGETEWCNRRILARIHRATLGNLRREIEPVTSADFERFLQVWQHVSPGSQLHGSDGTLQIIRQLQGYEIAASAWESEILSRRIAKYDPDYIDELCLSGEVMWARVSPHPAIAENRRVRPTRIAPVTLFLREDADWLMTADANRDTSALSDAAKDVLATLERNGASFFIDLSRQSHRLASEVEDGLWELLAGGFVTADGFDNLRALIDPKRRRGEGRGSKRRPRHAAGRWALLTSAVVNLSTEDRTERCVRQLLARWGVLVRDLLARETLSPPWRDLLPILRRMEARGEIRGGRFVAGLTGEQFARPEALDLLRMVRRGTRPAQSVSVSNADPLNLSGIILPGPRVSRLLASPVSA